jgi:4-aminobutyrate aminotransferase
MLDERLISEGDVNLSEKRKNWDQYTDPETKTWLDKDEKYFLHQSMSTPCLDVIDTSGGAIIQNLSGQKYLDFHGNSAHQVGFQNQYIIEAIQEQLSKLSFCTRRFTNIPAIRLAEKLIQFTGNKFGKVLFAPGGTLAIGMALKLARAITGKHKVISFWDSFHGASLDAISVGGEAGFRHQMGPVMPGVERIPPPNLYRGLLGNQEKKYLDYLEYVIQKEGEIGAFIAEPIRNTDVVVPSQSFWQKVRSLCDEHGIFLIFDEIPTGLGRIGAMFVYQYYGVVPDALCLGKGLGGGILPLAAMLTHEKYDRVSDLSIGHYTHEKNPLCAAAGLATLEFLESENLIPKVQSDEVFIRERLDRMKERYDIIGDVRGKGLLWAVELVKNRRTKERAITETEQIMYCCLRDGLSFKMSHGNIILLSPSMVITRQGLDKALFILQHHISKVNKSIQGA